MTDQNDAPQNGKLSPKMTDQNDAPQNGNELKTSRVYWAPAARCTLANFVPEKRAENGMIIQPEVSLHFENHMLATTDKKVMGFVETHPMFKKGQIIRVANMREGEVLTLQQAHKKNAQTTFKAEDVSVKHLTLGPGE
jgi:hypothetical protein